MENYLEVNKHTHTSNGELLRGQQNIHILVMENIRDQQTTSNGELLRDHQTYTY